MVLAEGEHLNVPDHDHVVGVLVEDARAHGLGHAVLVALGEEGQGLGRSPGRVPQALPVRILTNVGQDGSSRTGISFFIILLY